MKSIKTGLMMLFVSLASGCAADVDGVSEPVEARREAISNKDFDVDFSDCAEFAGIGLVPAAGALPYVPSGYTLAGGAGQALVVVRVARCANAIVDGKAVGATTTSQVGITLQGPDPSADINNYTVLYATNQATLHARYQAAGVDADKSKDISLSLVNGLLEASSASPQSTPFAVSGPAAPPAAPPTTFAASWWANGRHGTLQSRTSFPQIRFGGATTTLVTTPGSPLAALLGSSTFTFALLDSYNTFPSAHLEVRVQ